MYKRIYAAAYIIFNENVFEMCVAMFKLWSVCVSLQVFITSIIIYFILCVMSAWTTNTEDICFSFSKTTHTAFDLSFVLNGATLDYLQNCIWSMFGMAQCFFLMLPRTPPNTLYYQRVGNVYTRWTSIQCLNTHIWIFKCEREWKHTQTTRWKFHVGSITVVQIRFRWVLFMSWQTKYNHILLFLCFQIRHFHPKNSISIENDYGEKSLKLWEKWEKKINNNDDNSNHHKCPWFLVPSNTFAISQSRIVINGFTKHPKHLTNAPSNRLYRFRFPFVCRIHHQMLFAQFITLNILIHFFYIFYLVFRFNHT